MGATAVGCMRSVAITFEVLLSCLIRGAWQRRGLMVATGVLFVSRGLATTSSFDRACTLYAGEPQDLRRLVTTRVTLALTLVIAWLLMRCAQRVHGVVGERAIRIVCHLLDLIVAVWAIGLSLRLVCASCFRSCC